MAKTYVDAAKYMVHTEFEIDGVVDKPDIVGAIFGQSEGLLGEHMDLKELQKAGKVGRIEIKHYTHLGKTKGEILTPSSMDMVQTSILAATIESVDKVGPCDAKFATVKIEDLRSAKRQAITERARDLLQKFKLESLPSHQQLETTIRESARAAEIRSWGKDKLPCGPDIEKSEEIIVVEGRADVLNLSRNNINNAIGMGGTKISPMLIPLLRNKTVTVFVDGDRGGELNARKLSQIAKVDNIARAPEGKEVEELAGKEIVMALRKKVPLQEETQRAFTASVFGRPLSFGKLSEPRSGLHRPRAMGGYARGSRSTPGVRRTGGRGMRAGFHRRTEYAAEAEREDFVQRPTKDEHDRFAPLIQPLRGSLRAKVFDAEMKELADVGVRDLVEKLSELGKAYAAVFDGIITKRLVDAADAAGMSYLVGVKSGKLEKGHKVKALIFEV